MGDEGVQYLSNALRQNSVSKIKFSLLSLLTFCYMPQTLTILNLESNQIGSGGIQNLSVALRNNTVNKTNYLFVVFYCYN